MVANAKRYLILSLGWFFVVLGILGIFLPILQGILFLMIGMFLLSRESDWAKAKLEALKEKYPKFAAKYDEAEAAADRWWRKITRSGDAA
ncbi:MAG: PGPGW domain-containing protein [Alphaproteobacteria bacterium]|jgi:uncharacterized membrane protein YbaN (DUF454 family)